MRYAVLSSELVAESSLLVLIDGIDAGYSFLIRQAKWEQSLVNQDIYSTIPGGT
jgi:hypothetical protein